MPQPERTITWNISMIPRPTHPLLPQKMVLEGLPWVAALIRPVLDAIFVAKEADASSSNPLLRAHQPIVGSLFLTGLFLFLACDAQAAAQHVETASFATGHAIEPVACHAALLLIAGCDQVLASKSLPNFQCQGHCLTHPLMTYIHLCTPSCC